LQYFTGGAPKLHGPVGTFPLLSLSTGLSALINVLYNVFNNTLINAFKKLMQAANALENLTLWQL